jgi:hypothetical protein
MTLPCCDYVTRDREVLVNIPFKTLVAAAFKS